MKVFWGSLRRVAQIGRVLARHGLAQLVGSRIDGWPPAISRRLRRWLPMACKPGPERLRKLFEDVGGTFVKFGQMLALQPDILSVKYCDALFDLLDRVEPFRYAEVERIVAEELGGTPGEIFDGFEREPLATASVGQVHVAWLDGRKVAVKVQRPNVEAEFRSDIRLMAMAMAIIRRLHVKPLYWLIEPMSEFVGWTEEELDYRNEARYSCELRRLSEGSPGQYVPEVFREHTTRRILVVEFLEGVTLLDYLRARERGDEVLLRRLEARGFDRLRFAANVIDNFLGDAFRHGIYHADLHPANLMILDDSVVGYIDFGITGVMSRYSRQNLVAMTLALAEGKLGILHQQFLKLSVFDQGSDLEGFRAGLEELASTWYDDAGPQRRLRVSFTQVMTDMLHLSRGARVMPERDIIKYIRSAIAIDGLNGRFEPDFHVGDHLAEVCARFLGWQGMGEVLTNDTLASWSGSTARLMTDGLARSGQLVDRWLSGGLPLAVHLEGQDDKGAAARSRAVHLAAFVLLLALMIRFGGDDPSFGFNLFTAEVTLAAAGLAMLLPTLQRLAQPPQGGPHA